MATGYTEDVMSEHVRCENIFSACYQRDLYLLAKERGLQTETTVWEPDPDRAWELAVRLIHLDKLVVWFFEWLDPSSDLGLAKGKKNQENQMGKRYPLTPRSQTYDPEILRPRLLTRRNWGMII